MLQKGIEEGNKFLIVWSNKTFLKTQIIYGLICLLGV